MQHAASEARRAKQQPAKSCSQTRPEKGEGREGGGGTGNGGYTAEFQARLADVRLDKQPEWSQWSRHKQWRSQRGFTEQWLREDPPGGLPLAGCSVNTN